MDEAGPTKDKGDEAREVATFLEEKRMRPEGGYPGPKPRWN
jgi:hypothetical protein